MSPSSFLSRSLQLRRVRQLRGSPRIKRIWDRLRPGVHDDRKGPGHDLRVQRSRIMPLGTRSNSDTAVGDQPRKYIQTVRSCSSGFAFASKCLPAKVQTFSTSGYQIDTTSSPESVGRRQIELCHGQVRSSLLSYGRLARKEAGLEAVGARPQTKVEAGGLNLLFLDRRIRRYALLVDELPYVLCRKHTLFARPLILRRRRFRKELRCVVFCQVNDL